jgi:hypothetical protein
MIHRMGIILAHIVVKGPCHLAGVDAIRFRL